MAAEGSGAVPFDCQCVAGYAGMRCEANVCASTPCLNGGSCAFADKGYECNCGCGYHGRNCEEVSELDCAACSMEFIVRGSTTNVGGSLVELSEVKLFNEAGVNVAPEAIAVLLNTETGVGAASDINDRSYWRNRVTGGNFVSRNAFLGGDLAKLTFPYDQKIVSAELYTTNYESFGADAQIIAGSVSIPLRTVYLANDPAQRCFAGGQVLASPCSTEGGSAPYQDGCNDGIKSTASLPSWDSSDGITDTNGNPFTLFLLPKVTFAYDQASEARYIESCEAYGLRGVHTGGTEYAEYCCPSCLHDHNCLVLPPDWGPTSIAAAGDVHSQTGWDAFVIFMDDHDLLCNYPGNSVRWGTPLHPVCGRTSG